MPFANGPEQRCCWKNDLDVLDAETKLENLNLSEGSHYHSFGIESGIVKYYGGYYVYNGSIIKSRPYKNIIRLLCCRSVAV